MSPLPPLLLRGDCMVELARIPDASVDAIVTDPPYGIDFMGKDWDKAVKLAAGMIGQLATGGKSDRGPLAKGGTHSQGYKNHDGLAFELWVTRWATECMRILKPGGHLLAFGGSRTWHRLAAGIEDAGFEVRDSIAWLYGSGFPKSLDVSKAIDKAAGATREVVGPGGMAGDFAGSWDTTAPTTDAAREWQGWGTALKPAFEPIVVARKPLSEKTVAANVLAHGTGALNIDATRIETEDSLLGGRSTSGAVKASHDGWNRPFMDDAEHVEAIRDAARDRQGKASGRWPANVILDESQAAALDEQSGASRFFYVAKAPKSERPVTPDGVAHPTVKPLALMRYLVRLVTPPGGCVVDPFAGSGTTLEAAYLEGFESIGVELTPDYWPLIEARIERVSRGA
jgi:site-specific DNA-methyltransferase (adenine-specific)